jgi:hypothetical protein
MKHVKKVLSIVLMGLFGLLLISCQKEEQFTFNSDSEIDVPHLKSALNSGHLEDLIEVIEGLIPEVLNKGNGNALRRVLKISF